MFVAFQIGDGIVLAPFPSTTPNCLFFVTPVAIPFDRPLPNARLEIALVASLSAKCLRTLSRENCFASAIPLSSLLHLHRYTNIESVGPAAVAHFYSTALTECSKPVPSRRMAGPPVLKPPGGICLNFSYLREKVRSYFDKTGFITSLC